MFLESSERCKAEPHVWLYHDNVRIAAHQGALAVHYWNGKSATTTGWFVETMALEDVQGTTIGPCVIMKALQDLPFNLSLGQTKDMRDLQLRLGWEKVAPLSVSIKPLNWSALLKNKFPSLLCFVAARLLQTLDHIKGRFRNPTHISVSTTDKYNEEHDQLWQEVKSKFQSCVVRDSSYLNWKYVQQPGQNFYRLEFRAEKRLKGIAVLKLLTPNRVYRYSRIQVIDFLADPDDPKLIKQILRGITAKAIELRADAIIFMQISSWLDKPLRNAGFLQRPPTRYLLVSRKGVDPAIHGTIMQSDKWFVTQGDSDIDRPDQC